LATALGTACSEGCQPVSSGLDASLPLAGIRPRAAGSCLLRRHLA